MDLKILSEAAAALFAGHRLVGWSFGLAASKRRLGVCKYRQKRIEISDYYARHNPDAAVLDTLRHEIAHALAGPEAGHGPTWQAIAARIGATPRPTPPVAGHVRHPGGEPPHLPPPGPRRREGDRWNLKISADLLPKFSEARWNPMRWK